MVYTCEREVLTGVVQSVYWNNVHCNGVVFITFFTRLLHRWSKVAEGSRDKALCLGSFCFIILIQNYFQMAIFKKFQIQFVFSSL